MTAGKAGGEREGPEVQIGLLWPATDERGSHSLWRSSIQEPPREFLSALTEKKTVVDPGSAFVLKNL